MKRVVIGVLVGAGLGLIAAGMAIAEKRSVRAGCTKRCVSELQDCTAGVRADRRDCLEPCRPLRDAVEAACQEGDEESQACLDALDALRDCALPCRKAYHRDSHMCVRDAVNCLRGGCSPADPDPTPTPTPFILN